MLIVCGQGVLRLAQNSAGSICRRFVIVVQQVNVSSKANPQRLNSGFVVVDTDLIVLSPNPLHNRG